MSTLLTQEILELPRPLPSGSQLDIAVACPGSRELPNPEPPETPAMLAGRERHLVLQRWVEAGCPDDYPETSQSVIRSLAPVSKLPRVERAEELPAVAEVYFWLDPVLEQAGVVCHGRRPRREEYPPGAHVFTAGSDAAGYLRDDAGPVPGVVEWKSRAATNWQVKHAAAALWLMLGRPPRVVSVQFFHPSGYVDRAQYGAESFEYILARLRLLAQELLAQRMGYPPRFQAGEQCRYCRAYEFCPLKSQAAQYRPKDRR